MSRWSRKGRRIVVVCSMFAIATGWTVPAGRANAATDVIAGPAGSVCFGAHMAVLPNGNLVVTDPCWNNSIGAAYLIDGSDGSTISVLTGSQTSDSVGTSITVLSDGDYVISSSQWTNGHVAAAGAVTWGDQSSGVSGVVSAANSIVGSHADDIVGFSGVTPLTNGNYVVDAFAWDDGSVADVGAVRWASGIHPSSGPLSAANSLVGTRPSDVVGRGTTGTNGVLPLSNGNYVVTSELWDNESAHDAGAVTWGNGQTGVSGRVSAANSLVGSTSLDQVGDNGDNASGVVALTNGNYVVPSPSWDRAGMVDAGAATWGDGHGGTVGALSAANSLVGSAASQHIGIGDDIDHRAVAALSNGNYAVISPNWSITGFGAVTWGDGRVGKTGEVSESNSLVGSSANDRIGSGGVTALANGNYVVDSPTWQNGFEQGAGAATWADGATGLVGTVSTANSLVGAGGERVGGGGITPLTNGNYVVLSPDWNDGSRYDVGAATWASGATGGTGTVSAANSLIGSSEGDRVGGKPALALANGNYVVASASWDRGSVRDVGAVTWADGSRPTVGLMSAANSLVGSTEGDAVGDADLIALTNGNYVVRSAEWVEMSSGRESAVTWLDGVHPTAALVSSSNSIIGDATYAADRLTALPDGDYAITVAQLRANHYLVTVLSGTRPSSGDFVVDPGAVGNGQPLQLPVQDPVRHRTLDAQLENNRVVLIPSPADPTPPTVTVPPSTPPPPTGPAPTPPAGTVGTVGAAPATIDGPADAPGLQPAQRMKLPASVVGDSD